MIATVYMVTAGWAMLLAGMVLSFLYSGLETGCYVVNKIRLDLLADSGNRPARRLLSIQHHPGKMLVVLLVGNNLANYLASAGMVLILTCSGWIHPDWYSVAILTPVIFIFCELLPKNLFHRYSEMLVYTFSGFMEASRRVFSAVGLVGLIRGGMWLVMKLAGRRLGPTETPLLHSRYVTGILAEGRAGGALTHTQSDIAERIVNISRVQMRDVMIRLEDAVLVEKSASVEEIRDLLRLHGHPRLGVYSDRRDNIIGVLNAYDALLEEKGDGNLSPYIKPALTLAEDLGVIEALVRLQQRREVMGFVVSSSGEYIGLVTIKDLVEEIVGELKEW